MKKPLLTVALLSLLGAPAFAEAPFCLPFASLRLKAETCDDNFALGKQADACLSAYTKALTAKKKEVERLLQAETAKGKSRQSGSFDTANDVFDRTVKELDQLILSGEQARLAVSSLEENLSLPEDYDQPQLLGMSTEKYLSIEPCYATPRRVISEDGAVLRLMVEDLKKAKAEVLAKSGVAQSGSAGLRGGSGSPGLDGKAAPAPSLPKAGTARNRESDVSGTLVPGTK